MESILSTGTIKEEITIEITHKCVKGRVMEKTIDIYMPGENGIKTCVFSETTEVVGQLYKTKSGIAGAVNLLHALLYNNERNCYYQNDKEMMLRLRMKEFADRCRNCARYGCNTGDNCHFIREFLLLLFGELRFKFLQFVKKSLCTIKN
jgi:hypothetical protein